MLSAAPHFVAAHALFAHGLVEYDVGQNVLPNCGKSPLSLFLFIAFPTVQEFSQVHPLMMVYFSPKQERNTPRHE